MGEDLQAFSDFLFFVLSGANALLSELAIAVFDSTSGGVEVYRGIHYPDESPAGVDDDGRRSGGRARSEGAAGVADEQKRANLLCIKYVFEGTGHYQALVVAPDAMQQGLGGPTLDEMLRCLDMYDIRYVVTDG